MSLPEPEQTYDLLKQRIVINIGQKEDGKPTIDMLFMDIEREEDETDGLLNIVDGLGFLELAKIDLNDRWRLFFAENDPLETSADDD